MKNSDMPASPVTKDVESMDGAYLVGLTKREYFAGLAMQGIVSSIEGTMYANAHSAANEQPQAVAEYALACADALLTQLEQPND